MKLSVTKGSALKFSRKGTHIKKFPYRTNIKLASSTVCSVTIRNQYTGVAA